MKSVSVFALIVLAFLLASCGSDSTGPSGSQGGSGYYPLTVGNTWQLSLEGFATIDTLGQTLDVQGVIDWEITGDTVHTEGYQLFCWRELSVLQYSLGGVPLYIDSLDFVNYIAEEDSVIRAYVSPSTSWYRVWMMYPVEVGDWWYSDPEYPSRIMTVMSLDSSVAVPAGSFTCLYLQQTEPEFLDSYVDYFYASGVGPVKYIVHLEEDGNIYHSITSMETYSVL
jgi:hypothetical protein